jgi:hypothetical protein
MTTYDPYNNYWHDRFDRPFAGYPTHDRAMPAPVIPAPAPRFLGKAAALAAVLVGTLGVGAALGLAVFDLANSAPAGPIVLPGSAAAPAAPQVPLVVSPIVVEPGPAGVVSAPESGSDAPQTVTVNVPQPAAPPPDGPGTPQTGPGTPQTGPGTPQTGPVPDIILTRPDFVPVVKNPAPLGGSDVGGPGPGPSNKP